MAYWFLIQVGLLFIIGILTNWIDIASAIGGFILVWVTIPYVIIWMVVSTIKELKKQKAADAEEVSNKKG